MSDATPLSESSVESLAVELLEEQGFSHIHAPDLAPGAEASERSSFGDVLLLGRLRDAVARINPGVPADALDDAVAQVRRLGSSDLVADNRAFHKMLTEGVRVSYRRSEDGDGGGDERGGEEACRLPSVLCGEQGG